MRISQIGLRRTEQIANHELHRYAKAENDLQNQKYDFPYYDPVRGLHKRCLWMLHVLLYIG